MRISGIVIAAKKTNKLYEPHGRSQHQIIMNIETITGIAASILTATALIPQLAKVITQKKAENVSMWMLLVLFAGLGFWVAYGILKQDVIIIASNSFSFVVNMLLGFFTLKYKK